MSKDNFKAFARLHPELATSVLDGNVTWQKLYELYDIYGENSSVWNSYFKNTTVRTNILKDSGIDDVLNTIKKVDLEKVQSGIQNLEKAIGVLQGIGIGKSSNSIKDTYEPRPMYKYFDD